MQKHDEQNVTILSRDGINITYFVFAAASNVLSVVIKAQGPRIAIECWHLGHFGKITCTDDVLYPVSYN